MAASVELLGPSHVSALRALLARDPTPNLYLLGLMEEFGVVCSQDRVPFRYWGRFEKGDLTAVLFVGGDGGLLVPSASPVGHVADLARALQGKVRLQSCAGDKLLVDTLCQHFASRPRFSKNQKLYSVSADDLGPFTNPQLRAAVEADVTQLVPMAAACIKETLTRDPLLEDPKGFPERVLQRVQSGRTYVLEEQGSLVFKVDVGSRSQFGAELEGLYTIPPERKKGHATLCLGQISRFLLSSLPRLALRVDDENLWLSTLVRKVGYLAGRAQRLVWNR